MDSVEVQEAEPENKVMEEDEAGEEDEMEDEGEVGETDEKGAASRVTLDDDGLDWMRNKSLLKPDDQLELPDVDLEEEVGRLLSTQNPQWKATDVAFNYGLGEFVPKPLPSVGKVYVLLSFQGTAIRKDSEEAKAQIAAGYNTVTFDDAGPKRIKVKKTTTEEEEEEEEEAAAEPEPGKEEGTEEAEEEEEETEEKPEEVAAEEKPKAKDDAEGEGELGDEDEPIEDETDKFEEEEPIMIVPRVKKLANQFNFCERAALTYNNPVRSVETQTVPPPRANYAATALQSIIFDFYQEDYARKLKEKEEEKPKRVRKKETGAKRRSEQEIHDEQLAARIRDAWCILERLVNQNIYDEISQDYRYWEDPSDEFREGLGSVLPLWKFTYDRMRHHTVTDLFWNPHYHDLFAVAYGSLDFTMPQKEGCLCLYSLKNPAYPEYAAATDSAVMCLDVHPDLPYLVCVGRYDGNVCVYNTMLTLNIEYQYKSDSVNAKHSTIVWEVKWGPKLVDGESSFYSISGDGRVVQWAVMPSELIATTIIQLHADRPPVAGPDGTLITVKSCGSAICFHPSRAGVFLAGTEAGLVHTCSVAYARTYLGTLNAHRMPVHRINYNHYNPAVFITCGGDWRVKIWEDDRSEPLFTFDLGSCVGDVKWAPYSSTVFAACTSDGRLYVFDLNVNKYKPISCQNIVSKKSKKLTRIDFNRRLPVIVCGDTKGTCHVLKLSPNLRVMCKAPKKQQHLDQQTLQVMKLDKLLSLVRDPPFTAGVIEEQFEED